MQTEQFNVLGMSCAACSSRVEKTVSSLQGVSSCSVNLLTGSMEVSFDEQALTTDAISLAVKNSGYEAKLKTNATKETSHQDPNSIEEKALKQRLIFSLIFSVPLFLIAMLPMFNIYIIPFVTDKNPLIFGFTQVLLLVPVVFINRQIFSSGFKALIQLNPNMNSLIAIGSSFSCLYGLINFYKILLSFQLGAFHGSHHLVHNLYFESAAMILTFVTLGKFLEAKAKGKTSQAVKKLLNLVPKQATVERDGVLVDVDISKLVVGDILLLHPGESIAVDGVVVEGFSDLDTSSITGESTPVSIEKGSEVVSGSINLTGSVKVKALKVGDETTLAQIIKLVEKAAASKPQIAKLADRISFFFVPIIISIALLTFLIELGLHFEFSEAFSNAISVLVVACPCALGLATPTAVMVSVGKAASLGILVKDSQSIETLSKVKAIVFDKTGTLTKGEPVVNSITALSTKLDEKTLVHIAGSLEIFSEHILAKAIVKEMEKNLLKPLLVENFKSYPGMGVSGFFRLSKNESLKMFDTENVEVFVGNERLANKNGLSIKEKNSKNTLYVMTKTEILGYFITSDELKESTSIAISKIKDLGVKTFMLTGDIKPIAQAVSETLNLNGFEAELLPHQKLTAINELKLKCGNIAFVGDGINDSPSLVEADIGIAIGSGTDIAIEAADAVLVSEQLTSLVDFLRLSKKTMNTIKQNLFWALFYNALCIPIAAGVFLPLGIKMDPSFAAFAMSLSSITVTLNALRLKFFKKEIFDFSDEKKVKEDYNKQIGVTMKETKLYVDGMSCAHCKMRVEKALASLEGVEAVVNLEEKLVTIKHPESISCDTLESTIEDAGYSIIEG